MKYNFNSPCLECPRIPRSFGLLRKIMAKIKLSLRVMNIPSNSFSKRLLLLVTEFRPFLNTDKYIKER